jgi:hypothetical protein
MEFNNYTPFIAIPWSAEDATATPFGVMLVKAVFRIWPTADSGTWELRPVCPQPPLFSRDEFYGDPGKSSVRFESDFVPVKPCTDVLVNAIARPPQGLAATEWPIFVEVGPIRRILRVTGPRAWRRSVLGGWHLGEPAPCDRVPVRYEYAFGGAAIRRRSSADEEWLSFSSQNPIGCGWVDPLMDEREIPAAQIEDPDHLINSVRDRPPPAGLGALHRSWQPRLGLAGTFDQKWQETRWPHLPQDFNFAHYNAAPPGLVAPGYLRGDDVVKLGGLLPGPFEHRFALPGYTMIKSIRLGNGPEVLVKMNLDTILIDVVSEDPNQWRVHLSWRSSHALKPAPRLLQACMLQPKDLARWRRRAADQDMPTKGAEAEQARLERKD